MTEPQPKEAINRRDKPFILAMVSAGTFIAEIGLGVYVMVRHPEVDLSFLKEAMGATIASMSTAAAFYFAKKNGTTELP